MLTARPERMVLRVDRTDPSKNVVRGFRAFDLFLSQHPEWRGRVTMLALLDPSRPDIPEYAEYVGAIQRAARAVNDRWYMTGMWTPIDLRISDNFPAVGGGLQALRRPAGQRDLRRHEPDRQGGAAGERNDGVLILSENAGAHDELGEFALSINPFDIQQQADAIHEALTMPAEERQSAASTRSAHRCASTTSPAGSSHSSHDLA